MKPANAGFTMFLGIIFGDVFEYGNCKDMGKWESWEFQGRSS